MTLAESKTARVLLVMVALLLIPYVSPRLRKYRVVRPWWDKTEVDAEDTEPLTPALVTTVGELGVSATKNQATVTNSLPEGRVALDPEQLAEAAGSVAIEDPTGTTMDAFYKHLARTIAKEPGAVTRILHYGDSVIASDYVSGTLRRRMQERFGDSGHGFILIANGWDWYFHNDVDHRASDGWSMSRITGPLTRDGFYGLGGVSFHTALSATATFGTVSRGAYGTKVSRFDVYYLEQPGGGNFQMEVRGQPPVQVSTRGDAKVSRKTSVTIPDGAGSMTIRTLGYGDVRMFGVAMERDEPGVTYDALGALGGRAVLWGPMSGDHWKEQMALREPALVVIQYGTNESEMGVIDEAAYRRAMGSLLDKVKEAAPDAAILVASPLDRAERDESGNLRTLKLIVKIIDLQQEIAKEHDVAFWSTYRAMGGKGSMAKWVAKGLAGGDLTHPSPAGAQILGDLFYNALVTGYDAYASRHANAPERPLDAD